MNHICITTHNRWPSLRALLVEVAKTTATILVLDQASTDETASQNVWHSSQFLSTAAARQRMVDRLIGAGLRRGDAVIFLDDDVIPVADGWLDRLIDGLDQADICGADGRFVTGDWQTRPGYEGELPGPVDYVGGGWCAVRATVFLSGVEFDQRYVGAYWEDVDLCLQVKVRGGVVWGLTDVGLEHRHEGAITTQALEWSRVNRDLARSKWSGRGLIKVERDGR